jgi:hypothetical protein
MSVCQNLSCSARDTQVNDDQVIVPTPCHMLLAADIDNVFLTLALLAPAFGEGR